MVLVLRFKLNLQFVIKLEQHLIFFVCFLSNFSHQLKSFDEVFLVIFFVSFVLSFLIVLLFQFIFVVLEVFSQFDPQFIPVMFQPMGSFICQVFDKVVYVRKLLMQPIYHLCVRQSHLNWTDLMLSFIYVCVRLSEVLHDPAQLDLVIGRFFDLLKGFLAFFVDLLLNFLNCFPIFLFSEYVFLLLLAHLDCKVFCSLSFLKVHLVVLLTEEWPILCRHLESQVFVLQ